MHSGLIYQPLMADAATLDLYARRVGSLTSSEALRTLAAAIAGSEFWCEIDARSLVAREWPTPALGVIGYFTQTDQVRISVQANCLGRAIQRLRLVTYTDAEHGCQTLADSLIAHLGVRTISECSFTAIPRGGYVVLSMLAYALGLKHSQFGVTPDDRRPLVLVDDCALSGARFLSHVRSMPVSQIIFAHLYSHPDLRSALEASEPRLIGCFAAHDLVDHGPERFGASYAQIQARWVNDSNGRRCWLGETDFVCFPWKETDRLVHHPITHELEPRMRILPLDLCLEYRARSDSRPLPIQIQGVARGQLRTAPAVLYGDWEDEVAVADLATGRRFGLAGEAADMWRAAMTYDRTASAVAALGEIYDVDQRVLTADYNRFVEDLVTIGLIDPVNPVAP